jgi:hypothetical protein
MNGAVGHHRVRLTAVVLGTFAGAMRSHYGKTMPRRAMLKGKEGDQGSNNHSSHSNRSRMKLICINGEILGLKVHVFPSSASRSREYRMMDGNLQ